jgi:hypothetical protein
MTSEVTHRARHGTAIAMRLRFEILSLAAPAAIVEIPPMKGKTELYWAARPAGRP